MGERRWKNPVIYASRETIREAFLTRWGYEPDMTGEVRWGFIPVLFDDRMEFGEARIEESPDA